MKKLLCIIISILIICSLSLYPVSAESDTKTQTFKDIEELRAHLMNIYEENYDEFVSIARTLREFEGEDEYITYYSYCGPCTTAFQKILYDNGIVTEATKANLNKDHIFNVLRTSFLQTSDTDTVLVIDTTYKQYLTQEFINHGVDISDIKKYIPAVLIYEYGNYEQLKSELSDMKEVFDDVKFDSLCSNVFSWQYTNAYLPHDFQQLDDKAIMNYGVKFVEDLRNNTGRNIKELNDTLFLNGISSGYKKQLEYDGKGVYRCYIPYEDIASISSGFNVVNDENEVVFGAASDNDNLRCIPSVAYNLSDNEVKIMSKSSQYQLTLNTQGVFLPILVSIDLRAGENAPAVYAYTVTKVLSYGDVNSDGEVNITDVTELQKAIAKYPDCTLDAYELETANVLKTESLNIFNATEISRYLAKFDCRKCGQYIYCSPTLELSCSNQFGYIEMSENLTI